MALDHRFQVRSPFAKDEQRILYLFLLYFTFYFRPHVEAFAKDEHRFFTAFAKAFQKLQENGHEGLKHVNI